MSFCFVCYFYIMNFLQRHIFFLLLGLLILNVAVSQDKYVDSLYSNFVGSKIINEKKLNVFPELLLLLDKTNNTTKIKDVIQHLQDSKVSGNLENVKQGLVFFGRSVLYNNYDSLFKSIEYAQKSIVFLKNNSKNLIEAQCMLVKSHYFLGHFDTCVQIGNRIIENVKLHDNVRAKLDILICVGRSYDYLGNRKKAIEVSLDAVDLAKSNNKTIKLAEAYISLSTIYKGEDIVIAKRYALQALKILQKANKDKSNTVVNAAYLILGNVYYDLKMLDSAIYYYNSCKESALKIRDQRNYLSAIGNIGNICYEQKDYKMALQYNLITLTEYKKMKVATEIAVAYGSLADIYKDKKEYDMAIKYYDSALVITEQLQSADDFIYNYSGLSETYEMMGNDKMAFKYYKLYKAINDSVNNNANSKKIAELQLDFKYKSEQREKDLIQKNKDEITQEKIKQQRYIIWAAVFGGLCLVIFLGFTIKSNIDKKKTNKQLQKFNQEISEQKNIIEEKNNEITDSITYASRIQQGAIPDEAELKKLLPSHFVFFKPRDIVSGDFYWACKVKSKTNPDSKRTVVAVVDCTGHGVPGAFMSLVGNTLLNQTIGRSAIETPAQALDYINVQLPKTIKSKTSTGTIKDGMEVAMCDFHFDTLTMHFAGANSNIYLVRNGEIQIYKGDKQPIGESLSGTIKSYTNQVISLQKNDCVYLISDGYADQFGGEKGKKFKYKPLENLFCSIANKDVDEQRAILAKAFDDWKSHHEQVDDVLIMGIKI